jgi:uncharacterized protein HemX
MAKTDETSSSERQSRPTAYTPSRRKSKRLTPKKVLVLLLIVVLAAGAGYFAYKYNQANNEAKRLADPKIAATQQVNDLVAQVGKLVELPEGQTPTIATVTDKSKLSSQAFFKNAENGDKVLIYTQSKRAILYRPSTNKVIEIAPLNIGNNSSSTGTSQ